MSTKPRASRSRRLITAFSSQCSSLTSQMKTYLSSLPGTSDSAQRTMRRAMMGSAGVIHSCAQWKASSSLVATFGRRDIPGGLASGTRNSSGAAAVPALPDVELVYFDIHARGELVRLCYAAHAASGGQDSFIDTRLPFVSFDHT